MPIIQQLSPHIANLIAAGEVVERPCSVVKELLENAIDAGAKNIVVEIQNGGMTFIRVRDDGCGMSQEDAKVAFLRHATSKIRQESDLECIATMGFRGEALAAISSVSKIDLLTKTEQAQLGTAIHLDAGCITQCDEAGCPNGTTIIVRDLFYNAPARMKFMKRDAVEASAIFNAVQRQAMAHPELSIQYLRDGQVQLHTPGDGVLMSAIYAVLGRQSAKEMVRVESHWDKTAITGYVSKPTASRGNRNYQIFFVNGRPVVSKMLSSALEEAYRNQMMVGRFPSCVLHISVPLHMVDVNVHPAKTEVKFLAEREVFDCVHFGVLSALNRAPDRPELVLPQQKHTAQRADASTVSAPQAAPAQPTEPQKAAKPAQNNAAQHFRTMNTTQFKAFTQLMQDSARVQPCAKVASAIAQAPAVHEKVLLPKSGGAVPAAAAADAPQSKAPEKPAAVQKEVASPPEPAQQPEQTALQLQDAGAFHIVGEVLHTYIIVEQDDTVLFIDKHAAHERILFEQLKANPTQMMGQLLLEPVICNFDREEAAILQAHASLLQELGYDITDLADGTLLLRQIPSDLAVEDAQCCLNALANDLLHGKHTDPTALRDTLLHTIACKAAIKAGSRTEPAERARLVQQVMTNPALKHCPHGRPICTSLTKAQLERQFKRT